MELSDILRRALNVLRAIEGRTGLDQLDRKSVDVLLRVAEAEISGEAPTMSSLLEDSNERPAVAISRLETLERTGWLSSGGETVGPGTRLHLSRRAKQAFVATATRLQRSQS